MPTSTAWKTYDRDQVAALFAEDATYRYHPFDSGDDVLRGRDAIVVELDRTGRQREQSRRRGDL